MSASYHRLEAARPQQRHELRTAQREWLKQRDACGSGQACLADRYQERLDALHVALHKITAYRPDNVDLAALHDLRQAVQAKCQTDRELPLEAVLDSLKIKQGMTTFSNVQDASRPNSVAQFPNMRPSGVTVDEWNALRASSIEGGGENGSASYTLIDIDGDGQRDLVIDSYSGGTGLFTYTSTLRRQGPKFKGAYTALQTPGDKPLQDGDADSESTGDQAYMYSTNDRGANQSATWIRLRGRLYVAYRNGYYGEDDVYLLRPLTVVGDVPKLIVHYRYQLNVPATQPVAEDGKREMHLDAATHEALMRALALVPRETARDVGDSGKSICPVPATVKGDERDAYSSFGPGHYSYEIVSDIPVWIGGHCFIGRVVDWFGRYSKDDGLSAEIWIRNPSDVDEMQIYVIAGRRIVEKIDTTIAPIEGDNGM